MTDHFRESDYRPISQQYARGAINAVILVNGGASVAVLSQLNELSGLIEPRYIAWALILFALGITFGMFAWVAGFSSARQVDRYLRRQERTYGKADAWMWVALILLVLAIITFLNGCLFLALNYQSVGA